MKVIEDKMFEEILIVESIILKLKVNIEKKLINAPEASDEFFLDESHKIYF